MRKVLTPPVVCVNMSGLMREPGAGKFEFDFELDHAHNRAREAVLGWAQNPRKQSQCSSEPVQKHITVSVQNSHKGGV